MNDVSEQKDKMYSSITARRAQMECSYEICPREGNSCRRVLHACTGHIRIYVVEQGVFDYPLRVHGPENREHGVDQAVINTVAFAITQRVFCLASNHD